MPPAVGAPDVEAYARLAGVYDEVVIDPCHARWAGYLHELWSADGAGVRTVLDVCCGTGLMAAELSALGYRVVGVDSSAAMLERARSRLGPEAVLIEQTLPDLGVGGVFDAAVSTFDGLNYLTESALRSTTTALARRLRPGGWLVFDLHTDAMRDFTLAHPRVEGDEGDYRFAISSVVTERTCDTRIEMTRLADGDTFTEHHRQYFHTDDTVRAVLAAGGFDVVAHTDEYTHAPVGESTLRATWTARRAGI